MSEQPKNKEFAILFKKYRLRSEIESLSEFGNLLAEEGMVYENSLFTRWQNGERVPCDRRVVLTMIRLFVKRGGINSADEANMILESLDLRDLSNEEVEEIQRTLNVNFAEHNNKHLTERDKLKKFLYVFLNCKNQAWNLFFILSFILVTCIWLLLNQREKEYIGNLYVGIAFIGATVGLKIAVSLGFNKSYIGKSILYFSLGLFAQVFGQIVYAYYILVKQVQIPYPSLGDIGYFGTIPLYTAGVIYLAKALGVKLIMKSYSQAISSIILPTLMLLVSYVNLLMNYQTSHTALLTMLLDFGYPLGQSVHISVAILILSLSKGVFGEMKNKIRFIILALIAQYISDYTFIYQANEGIWITGGINDYMYFISYTLMSLSILQFATIQSKLK